MHIVVILNWKSGKSPQERMLWFCVSDFKNSIIIYLERVHVTFKEGVVWLCTSALMFVSGHVTSVG